MEYTEIIYLMNITIEEDDIGNSIPSSISYKKCYAKKQSVKTNEFYNAVMNGLTPSCEFVLKWNNEEYQIIRTIDPKNKFDIVLVCAKKIGINESGVSR